MDKSKYIAKLHEFEFLPENWDGYDSVRPQIVSINKAVRWIEIVPCQSYSDPHISADQGGVITFEWISDMKRLTLYFDKIIQCVRTKKGEYDNTSDDLDESLCDFSPIWAWFSDG
jgi:hypothetical protein